MHRTFGQRLKQFANTIDIVDKDTYEKSIELIEGYLRGVLNIEVEHILVELQNHDGTMVLVKHRLDTIDPFGFIPLADDDGEYKGQMPFAYATRKPLWIINKKTPSELDMDGAQYVDFWSGINNIPRYLSTGIEGIKTSIIIPLKNGDHRVYGVVNFETQDFLEITKLAKDELERISETISILYQLQKTRRIQTHSTGKAIKRLNDSLKLGNLPKLTKPSLFLASPKKADDRVIAVIKEVLNEPELADKVNYSYWREIYSNGNINQQLLEKIASSQYGICYFSQKISDESPKYRDNPNVVFEAGMFHGRGNHTTGTSDWLPIRELDSPPSPFDFANERMITVPRDKNGNLCEERFKDDLRRRINSLLNDE